MRPLNRFQTPRVLSRGALLICLSVPRLFAAAHSVTNAPTVSLALPDVGFSLVRILGALVLVLSLFLGGVWAFKNWQRLAVQKGPAKLRIMEVRPLGNRQALYLVRCDQQRLLLAASPAGIHLLTHLPESVGPDTEEPERTEGQAAPVTFLQTLHRALLTKS
jgi:flagellar biogenesis protein FliO